MKKKQIQLSNQFKSQAFRAALAIAFFFVTYLAILLIAIGLTAVCVVGGISLILIFPNIMTFALGAGLSSLGFLILIFLLKFIFSTNTSDRSHLIEINASQEPKLFELINEIVEEVGTRFPKRVYVSHEVNASVFYESSFWSMFLPVRKNLQIGLGLVNTVTKEELKSILAHEFGHFSQRSMKIGSYVHNVNQLIFNMMYENNSYENLISRWSSASGLISIFVLIAVKINQSIQWVMKQLYEVVNKSHLALSREMEFHADEVAASITGYEPMKRFLLRMNLADRSYNDVLNYYNSKVSENIRSESLYSDQTYLIGYLTELNDFPITNKLPDVAFEEQSKFDKSKLVITDQWASHPSTVDRIKRLEKTGYTSSNNSDTLANEVFTDIVKLQKEVTNKLFEGVEYKEEAKTITSDHFIVEYKKELASNSFDKFYNGYYDVKNPIYSISNNGEVRNDFVLAELFSDEKVDLVYTSFALKNDIEVLTNIANKSVSIKTYDYDGIRYKRKHSNELIKKLTDELNAINEEIQKNDSCIYDFFKTLELQQNKSQLERIYNEFFAFDKLYESKFNIYIQMINEIQFVSRTTTFEEIQANFKRIELIEGSLKTEIKSLLSDKFLLPELTSEIEENFKKYTSKSWKYFDETSYVEENLEMCYLALNNYSFFLPRKYFLMKKALLDYQNELLKGSILQ